MMKRPYHSKEHTERSTQQKNEMPKNDIKCLKYDCVRETRELFRDALEGTRAKSEHICP